MKVFMEVKYDSSQDQHEQASKLDKFLSRLYPFKARWERAKNGYVITLH